MEEERFTIGLVVQNHYGVLYRIAGLYNKRGYNIDSLAVGETENPEYSRMTIVSRGDSRIKTQMIRQLSKLYDVKAASVIEDADAIFVEHMLIKLHTDTVENSVITALINQYGGKIMNYGNNFVVVDITGTPDGVQEFIQKCKSIGIRELCRSGALALPGDSNKNLELELIPK